MSYNTGTVPTLAQEITGYFIPAEYSKNVIEHVMSNLVVAANVNTDYRKDLKFGSVVYIPVTSEITTAEVTPGTVPTAINGVGTGVSITVNKWRVAAAEESDMMAIEDHVGYLDKIAKSCAYAIVKYVDTTLGALFSALTTASGAYGSDGQTMTDDIIIAIREGLREADVPEPERWVMIGDPSMEADMYKIDKFVKSDYGAGNVTETGNIGRIYGMKVFVTNNLTATGTTGNYGVIMHPDALGCVIQENPRTQRVPIPQEFRTLYLVDNIFGVGELRDTFGRPFYTRKA